MVTDIDVIGPTSAQKSEFDSDFVSEDETSH